MGVGKSYNTQFSNLRILDTLHKNNQLKGVEPIVEI